MTQLGIDYGTTNTVVVCNDRGRYPIVPHTTETAAGTISREIFPSIVARNRETGELIFGTAAERCAYLPMAEKKYDIIRSLKRLIRDYTCGNRVGYDITPDGIEPGELLRSFAVALRESCLKSGLFQPDEKLEAVLTWPAHANGAQRHITRKSFIEAGFKIIGTLNEPTAAAIEFADRFAAGNRINARKVAMSVGVFDLGGGTFDASLVNIDGTSFTVTASAGIEKLGGDDFDEILARMFAEKLHLNMDALPSFLKANLISHARWQKESAGNDKVKSLTLVPSDFGLEGDMCVVPVKEFFAAISGLVQSAVDKLAELVEKTGPIDAVYLVGGSTKLSIVSKLLSRTFKKTRLIMTDKPFTSVAMGAAIHSSENIRLSDILSRTFGVLRLTDNGQREYFVPIFPAGSSLPVRGESAIEHSVTYSPRHNIGHLRYMECSSLDLRGHPKDGIRHWSDILFPYNPAVESDRKLAPADVTSTDNLSHTLVRETYTCDSDGVITVRITRLCDGFTAAYEIFHD